MCVVFKTWGKGGVRGSAPWLSLAEKYGMHRALRYHAQAQPECMQMRVRSKSQTQMVGGLSELLGSTVGMQMSECVLPSASVRYAGRQEESHDPP